MSVDTEKWDMLADIARINRWLDTSNPDNPHEDSMRVMKIGEEFGEAVAAYIGMTGQNPRKGITHTKHDLLMELADVAITALCAMAHFTHAASETQRPDIVRGYLASKVTGIIVRSDIPLIGTDPDPIIPLGDVPAHIPAEHCQACVRSGVGACDDFPDCPAGSR
jgi:hypothetical protein